MFYMMICFFFYYKLFILYSYYFLALIERTKDKNISQFALNILVYFSFFFFFSDYKIMAVFPCAVQYTLVAYLFYTQ